MKNDFYLYRKTNLFYLLILISIFYIFYFSYTYYFNKSDEKFNWYTDIEEYNSVEEINLLLNEAEIELDELDVESSGYTSRQNNLFKKILIYEYLSENFIDYNNLRENACNYGYFNNKTAYYNEIIYSSFFLLLVMSIILSLFSIGNDFHYGTAKYVYSRDVKRSKIIFDKYFVYISIVLLLALLLLAIGSILGILYENGEQNIIIIGRSVTVLNSTVYIVLSIVSMLFNLTLLSSLIFFICVFIRNSYISIVINLLLYLFLLIVCPFFSEKSNLFLIGLSSFNYYLETVSVFETLSVLCLKTIIIILFSFFSIKRFSNTDIA